MKQFYFYSLSVGCPIFCTLEHKINYDFSTDCMHGVLWFSKEITVIVLCSINQCVSVMDMWCVFCAVRTGFENAVWNNFTLQRNNNERGTETCSLWWPLMFPLR
jgi:hypothetical protein